MSVPVSYHASDRVVTPPAAQPSRWLADVRQHVRQALHDDDALLEGIVRAARVHLEEAYGVIALTQTRMCQVDGWPVSRCWIPLPTRPVASITLVQTVDDDGTVATVSSDDYWLDAAHAPARLVWITEPAIRHVRITYVAGYGLAPDDVPDDVYHAMKLLVAHWYATPGATGTPDTRTVARQVAFGVEALLGERALPVVG